MEHSRSQVPAATGQGRRRRDPVFGPDLSEKPSESCFISLEDKVGGGGTGVGEKGGCVGLSRETGGMMLSS